MYIKEEMRVKKREWENLFILDLFDFRMHNFNDFSFNILTTSPVSRSVIKGMRSLHNNTNRISKNVFRSDQKRCAKPRNEHRWNLDAILFWYLLEKLRVKFFRDRLKYAEYDIATCLCSFGEPDDIDMSLWVELSLWNEEGIVRLCAEVVCTHL